MDIATKRLRIIPLTLPQFKLLLEGKEKMEKALRLNSSGVKTDAVTQEAMENLYKEAVKNENNYAWYTNWQIILNDKNSSIGSACFMGAPDANGEVEIGYGTDEPFRGRGYMAEAVQAICGWASVQTGVLQVTAQTEKTNIPSQKVLQKSGMVIYRETEENFCWRLKQVRKTPFYI